ncbi:MAG: FKBP-type peptidyl-prolyl cis-trans isomerase [Bernardetiaceae bacterium]
MNSYLLCLSVLLGLVACQKTPQEEAKEATPILQQLPSGLQFIHYEHHPEARPVNLNDYLAIDLRLLTANRDTIIDTYRYATEPIYRPIEMPPYPGAPEEGLALLREGDSIHFFVEADKKYQYEEKPHYVEIPEGSRVEYQIKVRKHYTESEYTQFRLAEEERVIEEVLQRKKDELGLVYQQHPSGIYYRIEAHVEGWEQLSPPRVGDEVVLDHIGSFMNGMSFDRTDDPKDPTKSNPIRFRLGELRVIPAWELALSELMVAGDQLDMIVPFRYAFGAAGNPNLRVPPFATLNFKLRLQEVHRQ